MKKNIILFICISIIITALSAQSYEQESITVIPFSGWQGSNKSEYRGILTDKIVTKIIQTHRFKVIDRSHLENIIKEQNLQLSGFIDESTAVKAGKIIGVNKFIIGSFTRNSTEYHKAEYYKGEKISDAYYSAKVNATIKMIDVETGRYIDAVESSSSGSANDKKNALLNAMDNLSNNIIEKFENYFCSSAFIKSIDYSNVILDRGRNYGIKEGMNFIVLNIKRTDGINKQYASIDAEIKKIGVLKIISVEANSSKARLMGDFSNVEVDHFVRETKDEVAVEATIIEKSFNKVVINAGQDLGLKEECSFNVIVKEKDLIDPITGEKYGTKTKKIGVIFLTEVGPKYSKGKIVKGLYKVKQGMTLKEGNLLSVDMGFSLSYGISISDIKANAIIGSFESPSSGDSVYFDFSEFTDINETSFFQTSIYSRNLINNFSTDFNFDLYNVNKDIGAWTIDFRFNYHLGIIPEYFYLVPGIGIGFGYGWQDLPDNIISEVSNDYDNAINDWSMSYIGQLGARLKMGQLVFFGEASYRKLNFSDWEYTIKTGEDSEGNDETDYIKIPSELVPYPEVNIGPLFICLGLSYEF